MVEFYIYFIKHVKTVKIHYSDKDFHICNDNEIQKLTENQITHLTQYLRKFFSIIINTF